MTNHTLSTDDLRARLCVRDRAVKLYRYALTIIDAAESDGDGMAGVAFSAQVPFHLIDGKASQIAELLCENAIGATAAEGR